MREHISSYESQLDIKHFRTNRQLAFPPDLLHTTWGAPRPEVSRRLSQWLSGARDRRNGPEPARSQPARKKRKKKAATATAADGTASAAAADGAASSTDADGASSAADADRAASAADADRAASAADADGAASAADADVIVSATDGDGADRGAAVPELEADLLSYVSC